MSDGEDQEKGNALPTWGNAQNMNINNLVFTNIVSSPYFKNELIKIKTYHEVIDEIYYKVAHLEPWEKGSRKTHGQVGMCGGVRGVGAGGIVSSGFCLLYKLFTLKLTEKQVYGLINHVDSPYIRGLGFMYIRYCQHPNTYWDWFEPYLEDEEEIDPKAGGGCSMTIGQLVRSFLLKLDWYGTLFPRIPVPIHKEIEAGLKELNLCDDRKVRADEGRPKRDEKEVTDYGEAEIQAAKRREEKSSPPARDTKRTSRERSRDRSRRRSSSREKRRSRDKEERRDSSRRSRDRDRDDRRSRDRDDRRSRDRDDRRKERRRSLSRERLRDEQSSKSRRRSLSRDRRR